MCCKFKIRNGVPQANSGKESIYQPNRNVRSYPLRNLSDYTSDQVNYIAYLTLTSSTRIDIVFQFINKYIFSRLVQKL